ncbi:MAG: hypothetical protein FJ271_30900 [Planctomycetes bacterium]|nr:hypothetical protein [Planctomycetota bacterium]
MPFLTLEFVEGGSLAQHLTDEPLALSTVVTLVAMLARGLQHAHEHGIIHRDLKPDNVLLAPPSTVAALNTPLGVPRITDFGLAKCLAGPGNEFGKPLTQPGDLLGTPKYMAPEQLEGNLHISPAVDVWALGVILYRLLSGRLPFVAQSHVELILRICREEPTSLEELCPGTPPALSAIVRDCLQKSPELRPSAGALAERLERINLSATTSNAPSFAAATSHCSPRRHSRNHWLRPRWLWAALVLIGIIALTLGLRDRWPNSVEPTGMLPIQPLRVTHFETSGQEAILRGCIGEQSFATRHGDAVTLTVEPSEPAYFYLIGFNFDGREQLLWPVDDQNAPSDQLPPPRVAAMRYPKAGNRLYLDDPAKGGLQCYVVAASRQPLPAYSVWRAGRKGVSWTSFPIGNSVWQADAAGAYEVIKGLGVDRGTIRPARNTPPLSELCRALLGDGIESVEAIAFPVLPQGGG